MSGIHPRIVTTQGIYVHDPDYLLIKDLPGHKSGCIFSIGKNYIYYISYDPDDWKEDSVKSKDFVPFLILGYFLYRTLLYFGLNLLKR